MDTRPHRRAFIFHLSEYVPIKHVKDAISHIDNSGISPFELLRFMKSMSDKQAKIAKKKFAEKKKKKKKAKKTKKPAKKSKPKPKKKYF
jgi:sRNA-binding protein